MLWPQTGWLIITSQATRNACPSTATRPRVSASATSPTGASGVSTTTTVRSGARTSTRSTRTASAPRIYSPTPTPCCTTPSTCTTTQRTCCASSLACRCTTSSTSGRGWGASCSTSPRLRVRRALSAGARREDDTAASAFPYQGDGRHGPLRHSRASSHGGRGCG